MMQFVCFLVLLLVVAPGVSAQVAPPPTGGAYAAQPVPAPRLATPQPAATIEPAISEVKREARAIPAAHTAQEEPSRALWFVVGALVAVAIILAVTL